MFRTYPATEIQTKHARELPEVRPIACIYLEKEKTTIRGKGIESSGYTRKSPQVNLGRGQKTSFDDTLRMSMEPRKRTRGPL